MAYSPDGSTLASGDWFDEGEDYKVRLWDAATGQHKAMFEGHTEWINSVAYSPDGGTSGNADDTILLWNAHTGQRKAILKGHTGMFIP